MQRCFFPDSPTPLSCPQHLHHLTAFQIIYESPPERGESAAEFENPSSTHICLQLFVPPPGSFYPPESSPRVGGWEVVRGLSRPKLSSPEAGRRSWYAEVTSRGGGGRYLSHRPPRPCPDVAASSSSRPRLSKCYIVTCSPSTTKKNQA